jgi:ABC-2 type transport system permease protein
MITGSSIIRLIIVGVRTHLVYMSRSATAVLFTALTPVLYALIAIFLYRVGRHPSAAETIQASVTAGLMGIWSSVLFESGLAFQRQRRLGVLELLVAAPTPLLLSLLPITIATAVIGAYAMVTTIACAVLFFGVPVAPFLTAAFVTSVLVCIIALGMSGLLIASAFIMLRNAYALVNTLEYPIWMLSGMLVPLSILPGWVGPVSWVLPSRWAVEAVRDSALGGPVAVPILAALGSGAVYVALAVRLTRRVERRARELATLAL